MPHIDTEKRWTGVCACACPSVCLSVCAYSRFCLLLCVFYGNVSRGTALAEQEKCQAICQYDTGNLSSPLSAWVSFPTIHYPKVMGKNNINYNNTTNNEKPFIASKTFIAFTTGFLSSSLALSLFIGVNLGLTYLSHLFSLLFPRSVSAPLSVLMRHLSCCPTSSDPSWRLSNFLNFLFEHSHQKVLPT